MPYVVKPQDSIGGYLWTELGVQLDDTFLAAVPIDSALGRRAVELANAVKPMREMLEPLAWPYVVRAVVKDLEEAYDGR